MNDKRLILLALATVAAFTLAGCTPAKPPMSREQAKARIVDLVDETGELVGVTDWEVHRPYEEDCDFDGGTVWYTYGKVGTPGKDAEADAKAVLALWKKRGLKNAGIERDGAGVPWVGAHDDTGFAIEFLPNAKGYAVDGVSPCVP